LTEGAKNWHKNHIDFDGFWSIVPSFFLFAILNQAFPAVSDAFVACWSHRTPRSARGSGKKGGPGRVETAEAIMALDIYFGIDIYIYNNNNNDNNNNNNNDNNIILYYIIIYYIIL